MYFSRMVIFFFSEVKRYQNYRTRHKITHRRPSPFELDFMWTNHTKFKIRMSQLIVQIYKLSRAASRTARRCDILVLFLVISGAMQSGPMQCIVVKSEIENSYSHLYILLKSCYVAARSLRRNK